MSLELKSDEVVLCTVKRIESTAVFVEIEDNGEGSIVMSEVAAGRIRNLRSYVTIGKKIVCKVLKISGDHVELSLRRVTAKEHDYVMDKFKKEKSLQNLLKTCVQNPTDCIGKIKGDCDLVEFYEEAHKNPGIFEKYLPKEQAIKIAQLFAEKERIEKSSKSAFSLRSMSDRGVKDIQECLNLNGAVVHYLGSGQFSIEVHGADFKDAHSKAHQFLQEIAKRAKERKMIFESREK